MCRAPCELQHRKCYYCTVYTACIYIQLVVSCFSYFDLFNKFARPKTYWQDKQEMLPNLCKLPPPPPPPHSPSPSPLSCLSWIQFFGRFCCSLLVNFASRLNIAMLFLYALCCAVHLNVSLHFSVYFFYKMLLFNHMILWFYYFFSFLLKVKVEE